jgi:hypothetical protein
MGHPGILASPTIDLNGHPYIPRSILNQMAPNGIVDHFYAKQFDEKKI